MLALRSVLYAVINILPSAVGLVVMPFITHKITPSEYGMAGLYLSIIAGVLVSMEFSVIVRKAYVRFNQGDALSERLCACICVYSCLILAVIVAGMACWPWVSEVIPLSRAWVLAALFAAMLQALFALALSLLQMAVRVKPYCFLKLLYTFSYTGFALFGLFALQMGWKALATGSLLATVLTVFTALGYVRHVFQLRWVLTRAGLRAMAGEIVSLMPFRMALAIFTYGGPFLIVYVSNTEQSGLYLFAFQICNVIALVYDSTLTALIPYMVAHGKSPFVLDARTRRGLAMAYGLMVCMASAGLALVAPFLVGLLFPDAYGAALPFIGWIALARCFHGINRIHQELSFYGTDNFRRVAVASLCCALIYAPAALVLMGMYGPVGAAMGLAFGHGLWMSVLFLGQRWLIQKKA